MKRKNIEPKTRGQDRLKALNDVRLLRALAAANMRFGAFDKADALLRLAFFIDPNDHRVSTMSAIISLRRGDIGTTSEHVRRAQKNGATDVKTIQVLERRIAAMSRAAG